MTREEIKQVIAECLKGQGTQVGLSEKLPTILTELIDIAGLERIDLACSALEPLKITYRGKTEALTFDEVLGLVKDKTKFVTMFVSDMFVLMPTLNIVDDAVEFSGVNILSHQAEVQRVIINSNNEVACEAIELANLNVIKLTIQASSNTSISLASGETRSVPKLTADQITKAFNQVVSGGSCTITDATGNYHLVVNQADSLSGHPSIGILYYNELALSYVIEDTGVEIYVKEL